jgi:hypothetical protein
MVKLIEIRGVRCLEFFFKTMTPLLWGAIAWACFNQRNQSKRQHKCPKEPYNLSLDPKAKEPQLRSRISPKSLEMLKLACLP